MGYKNNDSRYDENGNEKSHHYEWGHKVYYDNDANDRQSREDSRQSDTDCYGRSRDPEERKYEL